MSDGLRKILKRKNTAVAIALSEMRGDGTKCRAVFSTASEGSDPFRDSGAGKIKVNLEKTGGTWKITAMNLSDYLPDEEE